MAEGYLRELGKEKFEVKSAGIHPSWVHPRAVEVMREDHVDISKQYSKGLTQPHLDWADWVITLCGNAQESCPVIPPPKKTDHWDIGDPVGIKGDDEKVLQAFREVRDLIKKNILDFITNKA